MERPRQACSIYCCPLRSTSCALHHGSWTNLDLRLDHLRLLDLQVSALSKMALNKGSPVTSCQDHETAKIRKCLRLCSAPQLASYSPGSGAVAPCYRTRRSDPEGSSTGSPAHRSLSDDSNTYFTAGSHGDIADASWLGKRHRLDKGHSNLARDLLRGSPHPIGKTISVGSIHHRGSDSSPSGICPNCLEVGSGFSQKRY